MVHWQVALAKAGDDLAEQGDLPHAACREIAAFGDDVGNAPAAFLAAGERHNAEGAVLIAPLHDADKRRHGLLAAAGENVFANLRLAVFLHVRIHDLLTPAGEDVIQVVRRPMKLLRAEHEVNVGQLIDQRLAAALGHATHETVDLVGLVRCPAVAPPSRCL